MRGDSPESDFKFQNFYCCYLLRSKQFRSSAYVGSTPHPIRRLRQHNGEIKGGAYKTRKKRPWQMVLIVHGFPTRLAALQFEWVWQNPHRSRHFCSALTTHIAGAISTGSKVYTGKPSERLYLTKIRVLSDMLMLPGFQRWPLKVHFFCEVAREDFLTLADVELSRELEMTWGEAKSMEYTFADGGEAEERMEKEEYDRYLHRTDAAISCYFCDKSLEFAPHLSYVNCYHNNCTLTAHLSCIAAHFTVKPFLTGSHKITPPLLPKLGVCPLCFLTLEWGQLIRRSHARANSIRVALGELVQSPSRRRTPRRIEGENVPRIMPGSPSMTRTRLQKPTKSKKLEDVIEEMENLTLNSNPNRKDRLKCKRNQVVKETGSKIIGDTAVTAKEQCGTLANKYRKHIYVEISESE
ncbi:uncharacterized protein VTP21DRAFT_9870 [Calcarisporiella thermophila]|uniref:uncharacterized protein n=1 Tax=Calcarisporiella thermophila TaxID=911321 RepID=UPI0037440871